MQIYQDVWINGVVKTRGVRDCDSRYEPIRAHCSRYDRPITVLDIGANLGYYSFRLSSEFDCVSVMIEGNQRYQDVLLDLTTQQKCRDKLILLGTRVDLHTLQELAKCEHFDVVLALRIVHHFQEPFAEVIDAISSLGDFVFFELPTAGEDAVRARARVQNELADHSKVLAKYKYNKVGEFPIHVGSTMSPMYLVGNPNKIIRRPFYGSPRQIRHLVESTFDSKRLVKRDPLKRGGLVNEWVPGINVYTYHMLNGLFPKRRKIARRIKKYPLPDNSPLTDIRPWNFILRGDGVKLIDHTSVNNSWGQPFSDDPQKCLFNTAIHICAGSQSLRKVSSKRSPFVIKIWLLYQTIREMLRLVYQTAKEMFRLVRGFLRTGSIHFRRLINVILF